MHLEKFPMDTQICPLQLGSRKYFYYMFRGFVKLKKFKKIAKNSEVGGWVKPQLGFFFFFLFWQDPL